jgi:lipid-A-disaccharide synthase
VLAVADRLRQQCPSIRFAIPVAPTLTTAQLADYAAATNPDRAAVYGTTAQLQGHPEQPQLVTPLGTIIDLWTAFPAYSLLANCDLCLTTVGANTAELARLGVPMVVILPTNKLDAMRAWDGLPGLLANLPWVGTAIAKVVNWIAHRYLGLLAWPNIWAEEEIVPELRGHLTPEAIAAAVSALLGDDTRRQTIRDRLQEWQAQPGAARALTDLVRRQLAATEPISVRRSSKFRT